MDMINKAIEYLKKGGVIICPTESCYGFSCDARNKEAIKKIHYLKKEPQDKPLTIAVSDLKQIEEFGIVNERVEKIAKKLFPCQLNLIISEKIPNKYPFLSKKGISFRIPLHKTVFGLVKKLNTPVVTTSVNIHGQPSIYKISLAKETFKDKIDHIISGGNLNEKIPVSTIYDTRTNKIVREGPITKEEIEHALK